MSDPNPFRPTRFEHHEHPLIWLSPNVVHLEGLKSVYLAGTRGAGKTSLLKAVSWRERLFNQTLIDQLREPDSLDYVAVYFRLPDYLSSAIGAVDWSRWYPSAPDVGQLEFEFFARLIEVISAQLLCEAFATLRAAGKFAYTPENEAQFSADLIRDYPELAASGASTPAPVSLDALARIFRSLQRRMNVTVTRGLASGVEALLPETRPGAFINDLAARVRALACGARANACSRSFHIKVCVDDCETLTRRQQKYLNSLVRTSKNPLFWIISYVTSDYDSTSTVIPNQSLTDADRTQIDLDREDEWEFRRLCEEVSALRIYYSTGSGVGRSKFTELPQKYFSLDEILGKTNINRLLLEATRRTLSADFLDLVDRSRRLAERFPGQGLRDDGEDVPPIWQTYIIERLGLPLDADQRSGMSRNLQAYLRRKQRAALLNICSQYRIANIPYAGASVVVSMSDGCVRDYLETMASILDVALERGEVASLAALPNRQTVLTLGTQREGIRRASLAKFQGIKNNMESDWVEAMKVVECLGALSARLQSDHTTTESLATPERGIFIFDLQALTGSTAGAISERQSVVRRILHRCEADGVLRPEIVRASMRSDARTLGDGTSAASEPPAAMPTVLSYRLHRRFAANFGFSFRGPYEAVRIPMDDFAAVCERPATVATTDWVERVVAKIGSTLPGQARLPL